MTALTTQPIARIRQRDTRVAFNEIVRTWSFSFDEENSETVVLVNKQWFIPLDESSVRYMLNTLDAPYIISMVATVAKRTFLGKLKPDTKTIQQVVNLNFATMHERTTFRDALLRTEGVQRLGL